MSEPGVAGALLALPGIPVTAATGVPAVVAGGLALGVAASWRRARRWVSWPAAVAAAASLAATGYVLAAGDQRGQTSGPLGLLEVAGLLLLLAMVVRWAPSRAALAVGGATTAAVTLWILRFLPSFDLLAIVGGCVSMAVPAGFAIVVGGYPRLAAARLNRSIRFARQAQRIEIAHDLHDYVAHDVTGMVAQAQAARYAFAGDPVRLAAALERIETIGLQALSAMDEMVAVLSDDPTAPTRPLARLSELPGLVDRFRNERDPSCRVELDQDPRAADPSVTPHQVQMTAHRVIVEGLTNVRRHAPAATRVAVTVRICDAGGQLVARVVNDTGAGRPRRARASAGTGLTHLKQRVRALDGDLTAGPRGDDLWSMEARIPMHTQNLGRHG